MHLTHSARAGFKLNQRNTYGDLRGLAVSADGSTVFASDAGTDAIYVQKTSGEDLGQIAIQLLLRGACFGYVGAPGCRCQCDAQGRNACRHLQNVHCGRFLQIVPDTHRLAGSVTTLDTT